MSFRSLLTVLLAAVSLTLLAAQERYELNTGWKCLPSSQTRDSGERISSPSYSLQKWKPAVVPGTVLTTQLANGEIPDPFFGMNNEKIPDIHKTGPEYYTYWFVRDFKEVPARNEEQVWLTFRGINYSCDIYLNGQKVNEKPFKGMFLRRTFNITRFLSPDGQNRLAVIVHPPDLVGDPNGGQGGDGTIARNLTHQYVAGWDWIQPIRDRNTGIWDKVFLQRTKGVLIQNPHVTTLVPGTRCPGGAQEDAVLKVSAEIKNPLPRAVRGTLSYTLGEDRVGQQVEIAPHAVVEAVLPDFAVKNPRLWWPAGYGPQNLYSLKLEFREEAAPAASDEEQVTFGIRELSTEWNSHTRSRQILVNGQKIFVKGGNWIISDAMLRFSPQRYDAEIRYHRDMNLNLIRVWGGALTERPEFYETCDRYGMLVIQDFWFSGDCNGRWRDEKKADDQWGRRRYPDDHGLVLEAAEDMVKMIRNHPSLAVWCGGNEITPPEDILLALKNEILPRCDGTRWFVEYSNSYEMSYNSLGGNGDGPYRIQPVSSFWETRTWPFNSEVGSVGVGDYESLKRFLPEGYEGFPVPDAQDPYKEKTDELWTYHKYTEVGYEGFLEPYGSPQSIRDFARKAQLVNYDQYRGLMEGFRSHMWDWYTGVIIWKTQNPWTALRGQMYDYYLDPNACLFGTRKGSSSLHPMCNPVTGEVFIANDGLEPVRDIMLVVKTYGADGRERSANQIFCYVDASDCQIIMSQAARLKELCREKGGFLLLELRDASQKLLADNFYWFPDEKGQYSGLREMKKAEVALKAQSVSAGRIKVNISHPGTDTIAFFNRISLVDSRTGQRILPAFYSDNYVSLVPGQSREITIDYISREGVVPAVSIEGWNVDKRTVPCASMQE